MVIGLQSIKEINWKVNLSIFLQHKQRHCARRFTGDGLDTKQWKAEMRNTVCSCCQWCRIVILGESVKPYFPQTRGKHICKWNLIAFEFRFESWGYSECLNNVNDHIITWLPTLRRKATVVISVATAIWYFVDRVGDPRSSSLSSTGKSKVRFSCTEKHGAKWYSFQAYIADKLTNMLELFISYIDNPEGRPSSEKQVGKNIQPYHFLHKLSIQCQHLSRGRQVIKEKCTF